MTAAIAFLVTVSQTNVSSPQGPRLDARRALMAHVSEFPTATEDPTKIDSPGEFVRRAALIADYLTWVNIRIANVQYTAWGELEDSRNRQHTHSMMCLPRLRAMITEASGIELILLEDLVARIENFVPVPRPAPISGPSGSNGQSTTSGPAGLGSGQSCGDPPRR